MDLEELDIDKICRTCKCVAPRMRSLYKGYENPHLRIDDMLMTCASVQVVCGDGLPSQICQACVEQLKNAFVFKRQCEDVDTSLREYAKNVKVNKIKEELESVSEPSNILNNFCIDQSSSKEKKETTQTLITPESADYIQLDDNQMLLTCRECAKIFTTAEGLHCHKCIHTGSMFKCKHCDKEYTELDHLKRHEHSHSRRKLFVCRICNKSCSRMEHLKRHLVTHLREKPYFCKTCNRGFNRIEHLHSHLPRCKGDSVYPCDICSKVFKREDTLEVHKEMHDNELPKLPTIENLDHIEDHYYLMDQDVNATFSDHSDVDDCFQHQVDLTESMDNDKMKEVTEFTHHDEESSVSEAVSIGANNSSEERGGDEVLVNEEVEESVEVKEEKLDSLESEYDILEDNNVGYSDIDCFKHEVEETETIDQEKINEVAEFAHYENTLRGNGGYDNNERKDDDGETEANENMESEEMEEKAEDKDENYEVTDEDSGESTDSEYLPRNVSPEVKRSRGRPRKNHPKVSVPGRSRGRPSKKVKMEDDGDDCDGIKKPAKRFPCTECSQRFCRRDYLVVHMRRHRGEKPFKCKYCGKGFPRATDLTVHERYHTGEKTHLCTVCGKGFGRSYNLRVHLRTHTGEKPYKCTYCKAAFAQGNDLKAHVRRHTGERFQCDLCTRSYLLGHLLTQHKRASHGINVMSNIRRLEPVLKQNNPDEPPTDSF